MTRPNKIRLVGGHRNGEQFSNVEGLKEIKLVIVERYVREENDPDNVFRFIGTSDVIETYPSPISF